LCVFFFVLAGLLLWPYTPQGEVGNEAAAQRMQRKMQQIQYAVDSGIAFKDEISEQEINAYLMDTVRYSRDQQEPSGLQLTIHEVNLNFVPDKIIALIVGHLGPARLTYQVELVPAFAADGFQPEITRMRLGHLPVPGPFQSVVGKRIAAVFKEMNREKELVGQVSDIQMMGNSIQVGFNLIQ
jgi:hypothetical protein